MQEPEVKNEGQTSDADEVRIQDVTSEDEGIDPIPNSFTPRPLNSLPWQEGERPTEEAEPAQEE